MTVAAAARPVDPEALRTDAAAWDAWVESAATGAYTQLGAWADVKRQNGWRARRTTVEGPAGPIGLQLLIRDLRPTTWRIGYAPRGPVGDAWDATSVAALTEDLRRIAGRERLVSIAIDPEVEPGHPLVGHLRAAGWRRAPAIQATRTRLVDLTRPEEELWGDLRSKWRQYVSKARRAGVVVADEGAAGLDDFYAIYVETARRAGFVHRARSAYEDVFRAFDRDGRARLLLARLPDGSAAAALLLLTCGARVIEPYGGMTEAGAAARANYLLKWEAIRSSRERGFATYDMWGVAHAGIEQFKAGFGGREVRYVGGLELITNPAGHALVRVARAGMVRLARFRARRAGTADETAVQGSDAGPGGTDT